MIYNEFLEVRADDPGTFTEAYTIMKAVARIPGQSWMPDLNGLYIPSASLYEVSFVADHDEEVPTAESTIVIPGIFRFGDDELEARLALTKLRMRERVARVLDHKPGSAIMATITDAYPVMKTNTAA